MSWDILFHDSFATEFDVLAKPLQDELLASLKTSSKEQQHGKKT
jgi:mRNA-degrading endonuclease RelE of RelBE toxin-antitoxin system